MGQGKKDDEKKMLWQMLGKSEKDSRPTNGCVWQGIGVARNNDKAIKDPWRSYKYMQWRTKEAQVKRGAETYIKRSEKASGPTVGQVEVAVDNLEKFAISL